MTRRTWWSFAVLLPALLAGVRAQQPPSGNAQGAPGTLPVLPGTQSQDPVSTGGVVPNGPAALGEDLRTRWLLPATGPSFQGWPVFPNQLSGLGAYPRPADNPDAYVPFDPAPPEPEGWPVWTRTRNKEPLPFAPELGLLIRHGDRVWVRTEPDEAFVPLFFYDKLRTVRAGASVEVRQNGEFELLLHRSTRLLARGPTSIEIGKLDDKEVALQVRSLSWLRIVVSERAHTITLPDGSTLTVQPPAAAAVPTPAPLLSLSGPVREPGSGVADLVLVRADEPDWLGGRILLTNHGAAAVTWRHASGEATLVEGQRVLLFPRANAQVVPAALAVQGAQIELAGPVATCRATQAGSASWSGVAFDLPTGAAVRFDPQAGRPFAPPMPLPGAGAASRQ